MNTEHIPIQTTPPASRRLGGFAIRTGEPFIIASKEQDPEGGTFVYPQLWRSDNAIFINWHFDRDVLDGKMPDKPNGAVSRDGGRTWQKQTVLAPPGYKTSIGSGEITSYWHAFETPGKFSSGCYRVATWRSTDNGKSWGEMTWTEIKYPGTRGLDVYDAPEGYKLNDPNFKGGKSQRPAPPAYLEKLYLQAGTRRRGPTFHNILCHANTLYALAYNTYYLPGGENISDENVFWEKLDWSRHAILMQASTDGGRTWTYRGAVAFDEKHLVTNFDEGNVFTEPTLAIYPDGEMVCVMRTGSRKPLYIVRSRDNGRTWSTPEKLPIRGVDPHLALMPDGVLVLATGRPDCTIYFSLDRGKTWPAGETLFKDTGAVPDRYASSTDNPELTIIDGHTLLYVHDAGLYDPNGEDDWLKRSGYGRIIGRFISIEKSARAALINRCAELCKPLVKLVGPADKGPAKKPPEAVAFERNKTDLKMDGKLDDQFWNGLKAYKLRHMETGRTPALETTFRIAWADNALYVGIECRENDMKNLNIGSNKNGDQKIWEGDNVELLIGTRSHFYYQVAISPSGAIVSADRQNGINLRWSPGAEAATFIGDDSWSVELRLPIVPSAVDPLNGIVGARPTTENPWHFNLGRGRARGLQREFFVFSQMGFPSFHEPENFGKLIVK